MLRVFATAREAAEWRAREITQYRMEMIDVVANDLVWFAEHGILARLVREQAREELEFTDIGGEG